MAQTNSSLFYGLTAYLGLTTPSLLIHQSSLNVKVGYGWVYVITKYGQISFNMRQKIEYTHSLKFCFNNIVHYNDNFIIMVWEKKSSIRYCKDNNI